MPRNRPVKALRGDQRLTEATALILRAKLPAVLRYEAAVEVGGVEAVHDMRIESKRLREAVRVLRPAVPRAAAQRLLPTVEELNDLLGQVRDRDVLAEALENLQERQEGLAVLTRVVRSLRRERTKHHRELVRFLRRLRRSDFAEFYGELMDKLRTAHKPGPQVLAFGAEAVRRRLKQVVDNLAAVRAPDDIERFHRQRIRVKKLKYALEPFLSLLPEQLRPVYRQIGVLQELMGQVHDIDVQLEVLQAWRETHGEAPGLAVAVAQLEVDRRKLTRRTAKHLAAMEAARFDAVLLEGLPQPG